MITFWAKLQQEQGSRIREKIRIDVNWFCSDGKQVLTPTKWNHKFTAQTMADGIETQFHVNLKISLTKFHLNILRILQQFFSFIRTINTTANNTRHLHLSVHSFYDCHGNTGMENINNGCRTFNGQMQPQRWRHHDHLQPLALSFLYIYFKQLGLQNKTYWSLCTKKVGEKLESLLDLRRRERCLRQISKSNFGRVWPWS